MVFLCRLSLFYAIVFSGLVGYRVVMLKRVIVMHVYTCLTIIHTYMHNENKNRSIVLDSRMV